jgi:hypothetical protein
LPDPDERKKKQGPSRPPAARASLLEERQQKTEAIADQDLAAGEAPCPRQG